MNRRLQLTNDCNTTRQHLRLLNANICHSLDAHTDIFNNATPSDWDFITIQEPYIDGFNGIRSGTHWLTIYPSTHYSSDDAPTRAFTMVNRCIATDTWQQIDCNSNEIVALLLETNQLQILMINVYKDGATDAALPHLQRLISQEIHQAATHKCL